MASKDFFNRKAQIEMMGLVVIVVLVTIILLFYISFRINSDENMQKSEPKQEYTEKQLATNYIQAVLKTTTRCEGMNIQQLLQDCALYRNLVCPMGDSCAQINATLDNLTNRSMDIWQTSYLFKIKHRDRLIYSKSKHGCDETKTAEATGFQPITLWPEDSQAIMVTLRVCRQ